jgi:hypothetical protein
MAFNAACLGLLASHTIAVLVVVVVAVAVEGRPDAAGAVVDAAAVVLAVLQLLVASVVVAWAECGDAVQCDDCAFVAGRLRFLDLD